MQDGIRSIEGAKIPEGLRELPQPPVRLYARGSFPAPGTRMLAVVGSRVLSPYGREACERLIAGLAGYPVSIVSGLALGADACAHQAALNAGLHTVAVLGSGIDDASVYPRANLGLARAILAAGGLLVSEREAGYAPQAFDFPQRNRLVAGLSHAVLIVEAAEKSGTLITARLAGEYGKELLAIPHRIGDPHGYGAHLFLRLGATLVAEPSHILEALGIAPRDTGGRATRALALDGSEAALYALLAEPRSRDELLRAAGIPAADALSALVSLELKGLAREEYGLWRQT